MLGITEQPPSESLLDQAIERHRGKPGALLAILEELQEQHKFKYLQRETLLHVGRRMGLALSQIYSVVTFYAFFNLKPQGLHTVCVCRGTACHTRGSRDLLESVKTMMHLAGQTEGEADKMALTTPDNRFTLRTVACFGQCALAPVVEVDRNIYGYMNERKLKKTLEKYEQEGPRS